jgi:transposase
MSESPQLASCIGLDWADDHHDVSLQEAGSSSVERGKVSQTPEALTEWIAALRHRFGGRYVGICLETSHGPVVHALLEHSFIVLYPVNPKSLKRFRETFASSGAKDDPDDADLLRELLVKHGDRLQRWVPDDADTRALARLVEARRKAVDLRTQLTQTLRAELKGYFPQAIAWTGNDLTTRLTTDFLLKWPTLESVQRAQPQTARKFYYAHNCRRGDLVEQRLREIASATPLTTDPAIVETSTLTAQMLARQIQALGTSILRYEQEIDKRFQRHPDADLFRSLPGIGATFAPRLLTAFGSCRERFNSAVELQQYTGIAPVTERSGKSCHTSWRWGAPKFVRQSFHEYAGLSLLRCPWAKAYYQQQRERGKGHHAALRALAFKWQRIMYKCWKEHMPYDDARYEHALRQRNSPLAARLAVELKIA